MDIRFLGQSAVELTDGDTRVLVDPFLSDNPKAGAAPDELDPTHILLTHGHGDHLGDTVEIAKRTARPCWRSSSWPRRSPRRASRRLRPELRRHDHLRLGLGQAGAGLAHVDDAERHVALPCGLLIHIGDKTVYHLGDTALFSDMQLIARRGNHVDVALVPIGGHYTMDRFDAVTACEFIGADIVIPIHYNTFPLIETDVGAFKSDVEGATESKVVVLEPGESYTAR